MNGQSITFSFLSLEFWIGFWDFELNWSEFLSEFQSELYLKVYIYVIFFQCGWKVALIVIWLFEIELKLTNLIFYFFTLFHFELTELEIDSLLLWKQNNYNTFSNFFVSEAETVYVNSESLILRATPYRCILPVLLDLGRAGFADNSSYLLSFLYTHIYTSGGCHVLSKSWIPPHHNLSIHVATR